MRKEISDRDIYIIALQTNLMSAREEIEVLKKKNDNLLVKNDEFQKMVEEVKSFKLIFILIWQFLESLYSCFKLI